MSDTWLFNPLTGTLIPTRASWPIDVTTTQISALSTSQISAFNTTLIGGLDTTQKTAIITGMAAPVETFVSSPINGTYYLSASARFAGVFSYLRQIATDSGTCTAAVKINGSSVTGLSAVSVTSTPQDVHATAANTFAIGDVITLVISSNSSAANLRFTLDATRTGF